MGAKRFWICLWLSTDRWLQGHFDQLKLRELRMEDSSSFFNYMRIEPPMFDEKIVSEYDQEIPQSQTADNPVAPRGRAAQPSRDTRKTN